MDKATLKDPAVRFFAIHLALYVAAVLICAAINLWLTPQTIWFYWVVVGWGIAVATHALALYLRKTHRRERIFVDKKTRGFTVHAFAYVATILLLLIINLTVAPRVLWFYWVALGWGAGLAFHAWCAFGKRRRGTTGQHASSAEISKSAEKKTSRSKAAPRRKKS